ncbi:MAG: MFS transporter [Bacteroidales bacterium]|nr:MFS transporter [Bacteroidales bacterium]
MARFLQPPAAKPVTDSQKQIDKRYKGLRLQVFLGVYLGYAAYYLVRKNFTLAMPFIKENYGFSESQLGLALAFNGIGYGISKFLMGGVSDRSDARKFLPLGLILASVATIIAGTALGTANIFMMALLQFLIGWFGGMGWPPCGRVMTHWFSRGERGTKMSIWNTAHNVGGGMVGTIAAFGTTMGISLGLGSLAWRFGSFYLPAAIAILVALIAYLLIRDTPQSCGLPAIEQHRNDYAPDYSEHQETVLSTKDIFFKYVLRNKWLWYIAMANAFVYCVRYGVLDWAPTYLKDVKGYDFKASGVAYSFYEWAAIPGTLFCGWLSDKVFKGRRSMTTIIFMAMVALAVFIYWRNPAGNPLIDNIALIAIGFFIYGPVMLIGVQALDLSPKNAAGASAGLTGFFGYFFGTSLLANFVIGKVIQSYGWDVSFIVLIGCCLMSIVLMLLTHKGERAMVQK